jgi:hypothetical protein
MKHEKIIGAAVAVGIIVVLGAGEAYQQVLLDNA